MEARPSKLCHHKGRQLGFYRLAGRQIYLSGIVWPRDRKTPPVEVVEAYQRAIARYQSGEIGADDAPLDMVVSEAYLRFQKALPGLYPPPSVEKRVLTWSAGFLIDTFGALPLRSFSLKKLKIVRDELVEKKYTRQGINLTIARILRFFKWCAEEELISEEQFFLLSKISPLHHGKTTAPESKELRPISDADLDVFIRNVPPPYADMALIQRLSGMRPNEICRLTMAQIDRSQKDRWYYRPEKHKTKRMGRIREITFGKAAIALLLPYLQADPEKRLFYNPRGKPMEPAPYCHACRWFCKKRNLPHVSPNRIRKSAAMDAMRTLGVDAARALLGHADKSTTLAYYLEREREIAGDAVEKLAFLPEKQKKEIS